MNDERLILIVEDNKSFRVLMNHFLSKRHRVVTKNNGVDAMRWLEKGNLPDLIILDLGMPEMTGNDFLEGVKSSGFYQDIPIIVVSGNQEETFNANLLKDIQHYFKKPFDPRKLLEKIDLIFTRKIEQPTLL